MTLRGLAIGLVCALGCSEGSSASEAGGPAGVVVELSGSVEASRSGKTRALAMNAEVFADDLIKTSSASSVSIVLEHNNAALRLEAGMEKRVDATLAWKAPKQEDDSVLEGRDVDDRTAAAGRHTEREAAATAATATANTPQPTKSEAPGSATPAPAPAPAKSKQPRKKRRVKGAKIKAPREFDSASADIKSDTPRIGGKREKMKAPEIKSMPLPKGGGAKSGATRGGGPVNVKAKLSGKVKVCHALADDAPSGTVTIAVKVSATGTISITKLTGSVAGLSGVVSCARKKISALKVAGAKAGIYTVTVKLR